MMHHRLLLTLAAARMLSAQAALPTEWIDPDTGHRVIRLSREDGTESLYFNQNAYTADGKKLIVTTAGRGIATIILATREVRPLVPGPVSVMVAGRKSGDVYYTKSLGGGAADGRNSSGAIVYATNVDTGATREVVKFDHKVCLRFMEAWLEQVEQAGLPHGASFDLDFHSVPANSAFN